MQQTVCDACGEPVTHPGPGDGELLRLYIELDGRGRWREYHRGCARTLTVAEVYARKGLNPL